MAEEAMKQEQVQAGAPAAPVAAQKKKKKKRPHRVRRIVLWCLLVLVLVLACGIGYATLREAYRVTYQGYNVRQGSLTDSLEYTSTVQLIDSKIYTATSDTKVRKIEVSEGDTVKEGDLLMTLANGQRIKADFDGKVNSIYVDPNDEVSADAELLQLADFTHLQITISTDEYTINKIGRGTACTVSFSSGGAVYQAQITGINYVGFATRTVAVYIATIKLDVSADIYPGMQVTVTIPETLAENALIVSRDAISFTDENEAYVYLQAEDGSMVKTDVTLGESNDDYAVITSGLTADNSVVYTIVEKDTSASGLFSSMLSSVSGGSGMSGGSSFGGGSGMGGGSWGGGSGGGSGTGWQQRQGSGSGSGGMGGGGMPSR